jgi:hypothetical protein
MKKVFKDFAAYIRLHDGMGKPKINFQDMYKMFPQFTFTPTSDFGSYTNFGEAFEAKNLNMVVSDGKDECFMVYREYGDANENLAYVS